MAAKRVVSAIASRQIGGPPALFQAALETITRWKAQPVPVNGIAVVNPMVLQVPFRPAP